MTQQGLINAVLGYERRLGHRLDVVHLYHTWEDPFPAPADDYFAHRGQVVLISWGGSPDTRAITASRYDAMIRQRAVAMLQSDDEVQMAEPIDGSSQ